jgi:hypothetical protein
MPNPKTIEERLAWLEDRLSPPDQQAEVLMLNNSANEQQPAKETETMTLPWQDISTIEDYDGEDGVTALWHIDWDKADNDPYLKTSIGGARAEVEFSKREFTHYLVLTPPKAPTVEVPVEPERVSVQEFAKQLDYGHWVKCSNPFSASDYRNKPTRDFSRYFQLYSHLLGNDVTLSLLQQIIAEGNPIYSRTTDPTAWLASQAEQKGVNQ